MDKIRYDIETETLKVKCEKCLNKFYSVFGIDMLSSFIGFKEESNFDGIAAYFTNDNLGFPAGYVVVKNNTVTEWMIIHELAHALENSVFGDNFEMGSAEILNRLGEKPKRKSDYEMAERLADLIADNIDSMRIMEIRKCLSEII